MSGFSRGKLEAGRNELGLCTARYESKRLLLVCFEGLARLSRRVWRRFVRGSREISLVPSLHRASTDALISGALVCLPHIKFLACLRAPRFNLLALPHALLHHYIVSNVMNNNTFYI